MSDQKPFRELAMRVCRGFHPNALDCIILDTCLKLQLLPTEEIQERLNLPKRVVLEALHRLKKSHLLSTEYKDILIDTRTKRRDFWFCDWGFMFNSVNLRVARMINATTPQNVASSQETGYKCGICAERYDDIGIVACLEAGKAHGVMKCIKCPQGIVESIAVTKAQAAASSVSVEQLKAELKPIIDQLFKIQRLGVLAPHNEWENYKHDLKESTADLRQGDKTKQAQAGALGEGALGVRIDKTGNAWGADTRKKWTGTEEVEIRFIDGMQTAEDKLRQTLGIPPWLMDSDEEIEDPEEELKRAKLEETMRLRQSALANKQTHSEALQSARDYYHAQGMDIDFD